MIPVFLNDNVWSEFKTELESWLGTPYRHLQKAKGRGADCTLYVGQVLKDIGLLRAVRYAYYARDWHQHTKQELVLDSFERHFREHLFNNVDMIKLTNEDELMRGDILVFSTTPKNVSNHCSVVLDEYIGKYRKTIHSINNRGVSYFPLGKIWKRKQRGGFRFMEI